MMKKIALVTDNRLPDLSPDDRQLLLPLEKRGIGAMPAVWDDATVNWQEYAAVVFRSSWDYYLKIDRFKLFLDNLKSRKVNVWNPVKRILWNLDKKYLFDLQKSGIDIIPGILSSKVLSGNINVFEYFNTSEIVVKPRVGADGFNVNRINREDRQGLKEILSKLGNPGDFLIQPYKRLIEDKGELSFVFLNGNFSHAVRKIPKKGDFRTQYRLGAVWKRENPQKEILDRANAVYSKLKMDLLYARLDTIEEEGRMLVSELEITEPFLYLGMHKPSVEIFAEGISSRIS